MNQFWLDHPEPVELPDDTTPADIARWVESHRRPKEGQ